MESFNTILNSVKKDYRTFILLCILGLSVFDIGIKQIQDMPISFANAIEGTVLHRIDIVSELKTTKNNLVADTKNSSLLIQKESLENKLKYHDEKIKSFQNVYVGKYRYWALIVSECCLIFAYAISRLFANWIVDNLQKSGLKWA